MIKFLFCLSLVFSMVLSFGLITGATYVYAANPGDGSGSNSGDGSGSNLVEFSIKNPFKSGVGDSMYVLIKNIMDEIILPIGGVLCVLAFIYAGFLYVTAQGDEKQITKANTALLNAAIGTAVLLGSWVLATAICKTIGLLGGPICTF